MAPLPERNDSTGTDATSTICFVLSPNRVAPCWEDRWRRWARRWASARSWARRKRRSAPRSVPMGAAQVRVANASSPRNNPRSNAGQAAKSAAPTVAVGAVISAEQAAPPAARAGSASTPRISATRSAVLGARRVSPVRRGNRVMLRDRDVARARARRAAATARNAARLAGLRPAARTAPVACPARRPPGAFLRPATAIWTAVIRSMSARTGYASGRREQHANRGTSSANRRLLATAKGFAGM